MSTAAKLFILYLIQILSFAESVEFTCILMVKPQKIPL
jgi:hypothetical protein